MFYNTFTALYASGTLTIFSFLSCNESAPELFEVRQPNSQQHGSQESVPKCNTAGLMEGKWRNKM